MNSGGRLGSGKLVLLKGSVSSKNCTLQASVAMMHPCPWGRGPREWQGGGLGRRGHCAQGRPRPPLSGSRAHRLRRAGLQPGLRPPGGGAEAGPGLAGPLGPLLLRLLPFSVPLAPGQTTATYLTHPREWEGENGSGGIHNSTPGLLAVAAGRGPRSCWLTLARGRHLGGQLHVRPAARGASAALHSSELRKPGWGLRGTWLPFGVFPSGRGLHPFQTKAEVAGSYCRDSENPSWAPGGEGASLRQQAEYWQHLEPRQGFPWGKGS